MAKELTRADFKDVESVVPSPEDRALNFEALSLIINHEDNKSEVDTGIERDTIRLFWEAIKKEGYDLDRARETLNFDKMNEELTPKEMEFGGVKLQVKRTNVYFYKLLYVAKEKARQFMSGREERLRSVFCTEYLAPMLLGGMRGGWLVNTWWRATCYGFSVNPWDTDERTGENKYNAFPYRSLDEMTDNDRRAFLWTVEDTYYEAESTNAIELVEAYFKEGEGVYFANREEGADARFKCYSKDGYSAEEIARRHSTKDEPRTVDDIYASWEYDMELYFPRAIYRQGEALYYAFKYSGTEYLDYIRSLNLEEDFDYGTTDERNLYRNIMKEGYVWHSDK